MHIFDKRLVYLCPNFHVSICVNSTGEAQISPFDTKCSFAITNRLPQTSYWLQQICIVSKRSLTTGKTRHIAARQENRPDGPVLGHSGLLFQPGLSSQRVSALWHAASIVLQLLRAMRSFTQYT